MRVFRVMKRGLFVTFEGIDGCGKSTQVWILAKHIFDLNKYNHVVVTREPWKDVNIRKILKQDDDPYSQAEKLASMYTKDRRNHIQKLIGPKLNKGLHVISDRYSFSTFAYQQAQGIALDKLLEMHKGLPIPDVVFIIDAPVETAMKRMHKDKKRSEEQKFEKNKEFIEKLRNNYLKLKDLPNHRVIVIDGTKTPNEIFEKQIKPAFDKIYNQHISE